MMKKNPVEKKYLRALKLITALLLIASVTLSGCVDNKKPVFTEANNGSRISLENGTVFILKLRENPTTGYSWELELSEGLSLVRDEYIQDEAPQEMVGVGGVHIWEIKVAAEESQQIDAVYKRPWENETGAEEHFELKIEVL